MKLINNILFDELVQAKCWEQYASEYVGRKIDFRKWFNVVSIALALVGGSTWGVWQSLDANWVSPVIFALIGVSQLLSAVQKNIVVSDDTLKDIMRLRTMYLEYFNKLEALYLDMREERITDIEAEKRYFILRESVYRIEELKDSLNIDTIDKLNEEVQARVNDYIYIRYNISNIPA